MSSQPATPRRTLLAIDGNSLTHRAYHAYGETDFRDSHGRPAWAVKGFWNLLLGTIDRIGPDAVVVGFDDPTASRRKDRFPHYKAHRKPKDAALVEQLAVLPSLLRRAGLTVVAPDGLEADDVMAAAARHATDSGVWDCVIATSDRDAFAQISDTTSVLRLINGGLDNAPLLNRARFRIMSGIESHQYLDFAALRGDASDNLTGVRGIGEKTATALLTGFSSMADVWKDIDTDDGRSVVEAAGKAALTRLRADGAREAWEANRMIMTPAFSLGLPTAEDGSVGLLPLDERDLTTVLNDAGLGMLVSAAVNRLCAVSEVWRAAPIRGSIPQLPEPTPPLPAASPVPIPAEEQTALF